jgi:histidine triad (HIT) family protein
MTGRHKCVFCDRIAREEYGRCSLLSVSFEPLNPVTPGHLLVIPRVHVANAIESVAVTGETMRFAELLANGIGDCNLITSVGAAATQTIKHFHIHIVPRHEGDGLALPWTGQVVSGD